MNCRAHEEEIQEQKMLLDSIYNTMECGVIRYVKKGEKDYKVLSMNQAALHMLDYEDIQECIDAGFHGVASHVIEKDQKRILSLNSTLKKVGDMVQFEYQAKGKNGDTRWILANTHFLKVDEQGYPVHQRTMMDITEKKRLELELRQEREVYQLALESSADILYEYDLLSDQFTMYVPNEEGKIQKKVIKNYWNQVETGKIYLELDREKFRKLLHGDIRKHERIQIRTEEGMRWYQISGKTVFEKDVPVRIVGTMHDIHEIVLAQKENQNALEELKINRLAINSLSNSYTGIHFVNLRTNSYYAVRIPEHLRSLVPKRGEYTEVIEQYIDTQIAFEDRGKVRKFIDPEYLMQRLNDAENHIEIEYRSSRKANNKSVWNRIEVKLVSCKDGVPEYVTINFMDITAEKQESLRRQYDNALLGYAISDSYDSIYEIGLEHDSLYRVLFDGKQVYRKKYPRHYSETVQKNAEESVHPDSKEEYLRMMDLEKLRRMSETNQWNDYYEVQVKSSKGGYEWISFTMRSVVRDNNKRILMFSKNVDERKRKELENLEKEQKSREAILEAYEAANRANQAKSQFLSQMSHDIRTPLNAIIGMTAIAGTHLDDTERIKDCLGKIASSGKLLLNLINEVLDMSKVENGDISLNEEPFNLSDMLQNILEMVKTDLTAKNQEIRVDIGNIHHEGVIGDPLRLQQIFMNLFSNSIKYTPEGGNISLRISERKANVSSVGCYEFVFEDNGIGMDPEFIPKIFEPFERAKDPRVGKVQGTGLGMAITQSIVRMMNGNIQVESELNKGTRISVTVFLKLPDREIESIAELEDLPILVVDDDVDTCETTCIMLNNIGMLGESVFSGAEAVEKVKEKHQKQEDYFAVIVDWKMPGMDGIETTRAIRSLVGPEVPVIILSAYDWSEIEAEAREAGVDGFIAKPLFKSRLVYTLKKFLPGAEEQTNPDKLASSQKLFQGKRVLLVEDNELNQEIAAEILRMTGVDVEMAENGEEAVEQFNAVPEGYYDLIFMDIQMPVLNGYEATRVIRKKEKSRKQQVPIVAMTANAFMEDIQMAKDVGMNGHLAKPLDVDQLVSTLKQWLS